MNVKQYLKKHAPTTPESRDFAKRAGISPMYLNHIANGHKRKPGLEIVLGLVRASDGRIKIKDVRPDLFKDGEILRLLRKSAA